MCYAECHLLPQISYTLLTRKHSVILKDRSELSSEVIQEPLPLQPRFISKNRTFLKFRKTQQWIYKKNALLFIFPGFSVQEIVLVNPFLSFTI